MRIKITLTGLLTLLVLTINVHAQELQIGAYYFDGWATDKSSAFTDKLLMLFPEREPIWGWRDDDIKIMERQIDVASKNGIDFFAFCWYWADDHGSFNEKAVRAKPAHTSLDLFLKANNKSKMKFCIMIANHDGARIDGEQNWKRVIAFFADNYFSDPQYLCIEDTPVVLYYLPIDAQPFIPAMRKEAVESGYKGLYTMSCGYGLDGFDALTWYNSFESIKRPEQHEYSELTSWIENLQSKVSNKWTVAPLCSAGWDKRPWEKTEGNAFYVNRSPKLFRDHLNKAVDYVYERNNPHPIIMIYAWNEYGEGGYIAPTKGDKNGRMLKQVKKVKRYARRKK
jgi:hypothetical protein